ncbi:choline ABC transporter substrate-binding protein [Skermanella rosea]|uniref:choline ABC transporter substrate-binding protein n=1 Tax=Skermanella rosea TaxID=1817965 RepID=UPI0019312EFD|nr:choline ABC transporter substrate-binding protein [Skermanella rosea]UEM03137.1 choline ABC transporter substrate-binding protein [Skermanella rosea]
MKAMSVAAGMALAGFLAALPVARAEAADPASCKLVRMSDPGWTDITATNAVAGILLKALGYEQKVETVAVPITFQGLKTGQIDVFLGNWMPAQSHLAGPLLENKEADLLRANLENAKFTLAVPNYVAEAGVRSFADLDKFADKFESKIYGIDPGAPANQNIDRMIGADAFGLGDWSLVPSSEQGMLAQVNRKARRDDWIVFLAWEPHPMNEKFDITYLSGGDEYFGANYGGTTINTLARRGYAQDCPNAGKLFSQLAFTTDMENAIMQGIEDKRQDPTVAAAEVLKADPEPIAAWLDGVTTLGGEPALPAVRQALKLD